MVVLARISSQNSGSVQIEFDYDAAPASRLLTLNLPMLVWMLLLVLAPPSGWLAGAYVSLLQGPELPSMQCLMR